MHSEFTHTHTPNSVFFFLGGGGGGETFAYVSRFRILAGDVLGGREPPESPPGDVLGGGMIPHGRFGWRNGPPWDVFGGGMVPRRTFPAAEESHGDVSR